jgi:hypothetical protein
MRWIWLAMLAGCYHADTPAGSPCSSDADCPGGQTCAAQHCSLTGATIDDAPAVQDAALDAAVVHDARPIDAPAPPPLIQYKATTSAYVLQNAPATTLTIARPACATNGVMVAAIAMGSTGEATLPVYTAPTGWTLVRRSNRNTDSSLAVYTHISATEPASYTWTFDVPIEGIGWISCYLNVDKTTPVDVEIGGPIESVGPTYAAPILTTTKANDLALAIIIAHTTLAAATTWSAPTNTTQRIDYNNTTTRSGTQGDRAIANVGSTGMIMTTASETQDYAIGEVLVLRQAP